ncbi:MAG: ABC transporter ATP-binding protein, partial [Gammaproteobacteria bacterium]|nr:ABC transporter ATP-binding protein [Gammaproteobacteria bacterium]
MPEATSCSETIGGKPEKAIVEIRDVAFTRGPTTIFDGLDILIPRGKITAVMGPSGTGKTTLLRLMTGQLTPDRGQILVEGKDVHNMTRNELYAMRRKMGMLFQNGALLTDLDVFENVAFPLREHTNLPSQLIRHIVLTKLHAVGLRGTWRMMPSALSGGMARRVAMARAMATDPEIIIYDEPLGGLDPISMGVILRVIKRLNDALNITTIVVSHDVQEIGTIADCSYLISNGKVVASGKPDELRENANPIV